MMPSRGLRLPRGVASPRLCQLQCRNISSTPVRQSFQTQIPVRPSAIKGQQWRRGGTTAGMGAGAMSIGAVRNASWWNPLGWGEGTSQPAVQSSPPPPPPSPDQATSANVAATPAPEPATSAIPNPATSASATPTAEQLPTLDSISLDDLGLSAEAAKVLPEQIGYLHMLGIDYGWGPTSAMQWAFEHIHIYTGLPWWASIVLLAVGTRVFMIPLYIKASDAQARASALVSVTQPLMRRMQECRKVGDSEGMQLAMQQTMQVRKAGGFRTIDQMAPLIGQGVIGFAMFRLLSKCAALPVPGFQDGGFLWLKDLTIQDPYLLLPAVMAGTIHLLTRFGGESGSVSIEQQAPQIRALLLYLMPGLVLLTMGWQSGAVGVWFASTGLLGIGQSLVLRRPAVRSWLGIAPIYKPKPGEKTDNPFNMLMGQLDSSSSSPSSAARTTRPVYTADQQRPMTPQWQAPNVGGGVGGKVMDVKGSSAPAEDASKGVFDQAKERYESIRKSVNDKLAQQKESSRVAAQKKRAADYEKRASERGR